MTATLPTRSPVRPRLVRARSHAGLVLAVVVVVVVADQLVKAWAWRTLGDVHINSGGNQFTGASIDWLLTDSGWGALADIVNASLLAAAAWLLVRFCRSTTVAFTGALLLAGWISNIGDRLGLHYLTAPDSVRGVVDYVPFAGHYWNLADGVIAAGSVAFVLAGTGATARSLVRSALRRPTAPVPAPRRWSLPASATLAAVGLAAVCVLAAVGTIALGDLDGPASVYAASASRPH